MINNASGREFGVIMILMSVGMLSGFLILLPMGKKLMTSVDNSKQGNGWSQVLSGCFMLTLLAVYVPALLLSDTIQALLGLAEQLHHGWFHDRWYGLLPAVDCYFLREGGTYNEQEE